MCLNKSSIDPCSSVIKDSVRFIWPRPPSDKWACSEHATTRGNSPTTNTNQTFFFFFFYSSVSLKAVDKRASNTRMRMSIRHD